MADTTALRRIATPAELQELFSESCQRPVWLFKHSLICPTSDRAFREFGRFVEKHPELGAFAIVEIQRAREVSREVAERTGVRHESPQALLLVGGRPRWHASHWTISEESLLDSAAAIESGEGAASAR